MSRPLSSSLPPPLPSPPRSSPLSPYDTTTTMSDPAAEPGAPTGGATNVPPASEKSIAAEVKKQVPGRAIALARTPDSIILRLNKYTLPAARDQTAC